MAKVPHAPTMAPLMVATAFAAYGWVDRARALLAAAERGPVWDAALEHRLFIDTLLLAFEGDHNAALDRSQRLERLAMPPAGPFIRQRIHTLRAATRALARAFAHQSEPGDRALLERAGNTSPLVFWAMRYAAAVVAIDHGEATDVPNLLANAPCWPDESIFRAFHEEIARHAGGMNPQLTAN